MIVGADSAGRQNGTGQRAEKREAKPLRAATDTAPAVMQKLG